MKQKISREVEIPQGIDVQLNVDSAAAKGPKGEVSRTFKLRGVKMEKLGNKILLSA